MTAATSSLPSAAAATGGAALTPAEARAVMVARVVSLVQGRAGVRREAVAALAGALNLGGLVWVYIRGVGVVCVEGGGGGMGGVLVWFDTYTYTRTHPTQSNHQ